MLVYPVRSRGQMFAQVVRRAPQMFAREVAIFRDKYREIGHLMGECNREIDQIRAMVRRELPKRAVKQGIDTLKSVLLAHFWRVLRARKRFLARRKNRD
jgi:hypothetical protein